MLEAWKEGISFLRNTPTLVIPIAVRTGIHYAPQSIDNEYVSEMGNVNYILNYPCLLQLRRK